MNKTEIQHYREISVWRRVDEKTLVRYRCFQLLTEDKYSVQSADFYSIPIDEKQVRLLDDQFAELLVDEPPESRSGLYDSLQEAISAHDSEFQI